MFSFISSKFVFRHGGKYSQGWNEINFIFKGSEPGYDRVLTNIAAYAHLEEDQVRSAVIDQLNQSSSEPSLPSTSSGETF